MEGPLFQEKLAANARRSSQSPGSLAGVQTEGYVQSSTAAAETAPGGCNRSEPVAWKQGEGI